MASGRVPFACIVGGNVAAAGEGVPCGRGVPLGGGEKVGEALAPDHAGMRLTDVENGDNETRRIRETYRVGSGAPLRAGLV